MNKTLFIFLLVLSSLSASLFFTTKTRVEATACKVENAECSINDSDHPCCAGLACLPFNEQSGNYKCGPISVHTPTPTLQPSVTPTTTQEEPTVSPTESPTVTPTEPEGCKEDCITPTQEPSPTEEPKKDEPLTATTAHFTESGKGECSATVPPKVPHVWYTDYKVSGDTASLNLNWETSMDYNEVVITYGDKPYKWIYGVEKPVEDNGSYPIDNLVPGKSYWFSVAYRNSCVNGEFSTPIDP